MPTVQAKPPKLAQELARRIVDTRGMTVGDRQLAKELMTHIAFDNNPIETAKRKLVLAALQIAVRDEQIWTALVAARAALGK